MGSASMAGDEERAKEEVRHQGMEGKFAHPWAVTKKVQLAGLSGDSGGATVRTPA